MHQKHLCKSIAGIMLFILSLSGLTFATEKDMVNFQGIVMSVDMKKQSMVVNEKLCLWNRHTVINDARGSTATLDQLKTKGWVYVEGVYDKAHHRVQAKTIYLLPKYVEGKEKSRYPFIK